MLCCDVVRYGIVGLVQCRAKVVSYEHCIFPGFLSLVR
jgi:hypothetical protein